MRPDRVSRVWPMRRLPIRMPEEFPSGSPLRLGIVPEHPARRVRKARAASDLLRPGTRSIIALLPSVLKAPELHALEVGLDDLLGVLAGLGPSHRSGLAKADGVPPAPAVEHRRSRLAVRAVFDVHHEERAAQRPEREKIPDLHLVLDLDLAARADDEEGV